MLMQQYWSPKGDIKCFPAISDDDLNVLLPMKEEIVVNKIFTFSEESCLVYIHKKNAVFIELEKEKLFIPTVYTLWKLPEVGILIIPVQSF